MKTISNSIIYIIIGTLLGMIISVVIMINTDESIVSTKLIEPYKIIYTKVDGKVVKTYYYKQQ